MSLKIKSLNPKTSALDKTAKTVKLESKVETAKPTAKVSGKVSTKPNRPAKVTAKPEVKKVVGKVKPEVKTGGAMVDYAKETMTSAITKAAKSAHKYVS